MTVIVYDYADTVHEDSPTVLDSGAFVYQALAGSVSTNPKGQLAPGVHSSVQTTFYNGWYSPGDQQHNQIRCQSVLWWGGQPFSWYRPAPGMTRWHGVRTLIHSPWTPSVAWYAHLTWHGAGADPKLPIQLGMYNVAWARSAFGPSGQLLNDSAIPVGCTNGYFLTVTGGEYPWVTTMGPGYYNQRVWFIAPVAPGKPETFYVGVRYATDGKTGSSTGWIEVWHDNQKVVRDVGPNLFKHQDGSVSQPYYLAENYHGNINGTDTVEYSGLVVTDTVAELQAFFYPPSPLQHAQNALTDLRASSAYQSLQSSVDWQTTKLYACEQELLATIKALS